jgi:hypothetical protein
MNACMSDIGFHLSCPVTMSDVHHANDATYPDAMLDLPMIPECR